MNLDWGYAASLSVVLLAILLVFTALYMKVTKGLLHQPDVRDRPDPGDGASVAVDPPAAGGGDPAVELRPLQPASKEQRPQASTRIRDPV